MDQQLSTDPRSVRTRAALAEALADEITATGDLARVTVTAVTERAGVTRRTFYSHYADIDALVNAVEDTLVEELRQYVSALVAVRLPELEEAVTQAKPCPGSIELLAYVRSRGHVMAPLLGEGGDPAFAERLRAMIHDTAALRALDNIDARAAGAFFDYYLTFVISAEMGVLMRWLAGGMRESDATMARIMTALTFVRPGDLYGRPIELDVPSFALALYLRNQQEQQSKKESTDV